VEERDALKEKVQSLRAQLGELQSNVSQVKANASKESDVTQMLRRQVRRVMQHKSAHS